MTKGSGSKSDFSIELPRSFTVPDGVIAHSDDIVIPVSWSTIDQRNQNSYIEFACGGSCREANFTSDYKNYDGPAFATDLAATLTAAINVLAVEPDFVCKHNKLENQIIISINDTRSATVKSVSPFYL